MRCIVKVIYILFLCVSMVSFSACKGKDEVRAVTFAKTHIVDSPSMGKLGTIVKYYDFSQEDNPANYGFGMYYVESFGRWTGGDAMIRLHARPKCNLTLRVEFYPFICGELQSNPVVIVIEGAEQKIVLEQNITIDANHTVFYFHLGEDGVNEDANVVFHIFGTAHSPEELGVNSDSRKICTGLRNITMYGYYDAN